MTQVERIIQAIRDAGSLGITTARLLNDLEPNAKEGFKGCAKYTSRISDARKKGWDIRCFPVPGSPQNRYFLFGKIGQESRFTEEYCIATTQRLALKRVKKVAYFGSVCLSDGSCFEVGETVLA